MKIQIQRMIWRLLFIILIESTVVRRSNVGNLHIQILPAKYDLVLALSYWLVLPSIVLLIWQICFAALFLWLMLTLVLETIIRQLVFLFTSTYWVHLMNAKHLEDTEIDFDIQLDWNRDKKARLVTIWYYSNAPYFAEFIVLVGCSLKWHQMIWLCARPQRL